MARHRLGRGGNNFRHESREPPRHEIFVGVFFSEVEVGPQKDGTCEVLIIERKFVQNFVKPFQTSFRKDSTSRQVTAKLQ